MYDLSLWNSLWTQKYSYLFQVTSKRYTIEAKKEHYKFDKLHDFMVKPILIIFYFGVLNVVESSPLFDRSLNFTIYLLVRMFKAKHIILKNCGYLREFLCKHGTQRKELKPEKSI